MNRQTRAVRRLCVFCGSKTGYREIYVEAARRLAACAIEADWEIVYGGGSVGLMGVVADAALACGGRVIGVIPERLATEELAHGKITKLIVVKSMHERKATMMQLSHAFAALPGGYGTLEELFEVVSWAQLGIHHNPIGLLNVGGYFDHLVEFIDHAVAEGFLKPEYREMIIVRSEPDELLAALRSAVPPHLPRKLGVEET